MAMFHPNLLSAVARVGSTDNGLTGTGFFYNAPHFSNENQNTTWFVTCKHVYMGIYHNSATVLIWINRQDGSGATPVPVPFTDRLNKPLWTVHEEHDVAVFPVGAVLSDELQSQVAVEIFPQRDHSLTKSQAKNSGVSEGDGVFILGFPIGWQESDHHYPVARYGIIAQIKGLFDGWHSTYLVDGSAFGGNSGSPVITKFEVASIQGTSANSETRLIGMVSAYKNKLTSLDETPEQQVLTRLSARENADLIVVIPMDHINETIDHANNEFRKELGNSEETA
ncbi:MAG: serine protease [bacterium]|nr:serine protease [bacterium]